MYPRSSVAPGYNPTRHEFAQFAQAFLDVVDGRCPTQPVPHHVDPGLSLLAQGRAACIKDLAEHTPEGIQPNLAKINRFDVDLEARRQA